MGKRPRENDDNTKISPANQEASFLPIQPEIKRRKGIIVPASGSNTPLPESKNPGNQSTAFSSYDSITSLLASPSSTALNSKEQSLTTSPNSFPALDIPQQGLAGCELINPIDALSNAFENLEKDSDSVLEVLTAGLKR